MGRTIGLSVAAVLVAACGPSDGSSQRAGDESPDRDSLRPMYVSGIVAQPGSIAGVIESDPDASPDACEPARRGRRARTEVPAVVWLTNIAAGKAVALDRRFEIVARSCGLRPVAQPVVAGGTVNVRNADGTAHHLRFTDDRGRRMRELDLIPGDMVVPLRDIISSPGRVRITCAIHPSELAWLLVFDHPYATTTESREFRMDSVPEGRYRMVAWQPGRGIIDDTVAVEAGHEADVRLRFVN